METKRTLRMDFKDDDGNVAKISISNPKANITLAEVTPFSNLITQNRLVDGKKGVVTKYIKSVIVERTETELV